MNIYPKNKIPVAEVKKFIIILYVIGILGFAIPSSRDFFSTITPLTLLVSIYLLIVYHRTFTIQTILAFTLIFIMGFLLEAIGVKTGLVFGEYTYGNTLGIKLFDTPLLIGLNWLFLTYTSISVIRQLKIKEGIIIILAPMLMLIYDIVMEQIAPLIDMWNWQNSKIPLKNYLAWYVLGVCFVGIFKFFKINTRNPIATILIAGQFVFFLILLILLK